jgi:hypothetical protein
VKLVALLGGRYLQRVVGDVLRQAYGRILRMLQQADVFKDVAGLLWLPKVGTMAVTDLI